jgi:hypothetical protein
VRLDEDDELRPRSVEASSMPLNQHRFALSRAIRKWRDSVGYARFVGVGSLVASATASGTPIRTMSATGSSAGQ